MNVSDSDEEDYDDYEPKMKKSRLDFFPEVDDKGTAQTTLPNVVVSNQHNKTIKRNIVTTRIYNDDFNPSILSYCREKHHTANVIELFGYNSNGSFYRRQLIWSANKQTTYKIGVSHDCKNIYIFHYKEGNVSMVKSIPISFGAELNCERVLKFSDKKRFDRESCDICYIKRHRENEAFTEGKTE